VTKFDYVKKMWKFPQIDLKPRLHEQRGSPFFSRPSVFNAFRPNFAIGIFLSLRPIFYVTVNLLTHNKIQQEKIGLTQKFGRRQKKPDPFFARSRKHALRTGFRVHFSVRTKTRLKTSLRFVSLFRSATSASSASTIPTLSPGTGGPTRRRPWSLPERSSCRECRATCSRHTSAWQLCEFKHGVFVIIAIVDGFSHFCGGKILTKKGSYVNGGLGNDHYFGRFLSLTRKKLFTAFGRPICYFSWKTTYVRIFVQKFCKPPIYMNIMLVSNVNWV
jgi:hypothetical protein